MSFEYIVYGDVSFDLSYSDQELKNEVLKYIKTKKEEGLFTYLKLCHFLIEQADIDGKLKGAKAEVYYQSPQLNRSQYTRVSEILWTLILDRKIFIDFYSNEYVQISDGDTTFGIFKEAVL